MRDAIAQRLLEEQIYGGTRSRRTPTPSISQKNSESKLHRIPIEVFDVLDDEKLQELPESWFR